MAIYRCSACGETGRYDHMHVVTSTEWVDYGAFSQFHKAKGYWSKTYAAKCPKCSAGYPTVEYVMGGCVTAGIGSGSTEPGELRRQYGANPEAWFPISKNP